MLNTAIATHHITSHHSYFDLFISVVVLTNVIILIIELSGAAGPDTTSNGVELLWYEIVNLVCIGIYTSEVSHNNASLFSSHWFDLFV